MNHHHSLLIIFLWVCLGSLFDMSQALKIDEQEAIIRKLNDHNNPISLDETKALLEKMHEATSRGFYRDLVELSEIDESKCDESSWSSMLKREKNVGYNIKFYVLDCFRQQYKKCLSKFEQNLRAAIEKLGDRDRERLELLDDIFIKHIGPTVNEEIEYDSKWIQNIPHLGSGLMQLASRMKLTRIEKLKARLDSDGSIIKKQLKSVHKLCKKVHNPIMYSATLPFTDTRVYPLVGSLFPRYVLEWLPRYLFCLKIYFDWPEEENKLFESTVNEYIRTRSSVSTQGVTIL